LADEDLLERWKHILGGPDLPGEETDSSSKARNTQFELFVGAWLTAGGVPVRLEEPDLRMLYYNQELGVAVKRVRSRAKFVRRACDGADQIEAHTGTGVVAINVDHLLDELPQSQDSSSLGKYFDDCVPEYELALERLRNRDAVKALAAIGTQVAWNAGPDRPRLHIVSFCKWRFITDAAEEAQQANEHWAAFTQKQADRMSRF
jgi:hypothetical protein